MEDSINRRYPEWIDLSVNLIWNTGVMDLVVSKIDAITAQRATDAVPSIPRDGEGPVFREPWEAQAFAMVLALNERGLFTWHEWAATLAAEIERAQAAGDPDTGETYYNHWINALERLTAEKGIASPNTLGRYRDAWERAAERTMHGTPIELKSEDFR